MLISQVDCWGNFVFATAENVVFVYLLDEQDRENNDLPLEKINLPCEV